MGAAEKTDETMLVTLTRGDLKALVVEATMQAVKQVSKPLTAWTDVATVAEHFVVSPQTIKNWIVKHGAPARRVDKEYRIKLAEFEAWYDAHQPQRGR